KMHMRGFLALLVMLLSAGEAQAKALNIGIVAFQMSSETHARAANAAEAAARSLGWKATLLNSRGSIPESAAQIENLIAAKVDAIVLCMSKPVELDAQMAAAKSAGIPMITIASGSSPHTLFDIQANEYQVGSDATLYLMGLLHYRGNILTERFEGNLATRIVVLKKGRKAGEIETARVDARELGEAVMSGVIAPSPPASCIVEKV